jgi:hypothetical protein
MSGVQSAIRAVKKKGAIHRKKPKEKTISK